MCSSSERRPETVRYKRVSVERGSTVRTSYFGAEPERSCFFFCDLSLETFLKLCGIVPSSSTN